MLTRTDPTPTPTRAMHLPPEESGYDLREMIGFVWRQWIFILTIVGTVLLVATVYTWTATPRYTANAYVLLDPQREKTPGTEATNSDVTLDFAMMESQIAIIKSSVFLQRVVDRLKLVSDLEFGSRPSEDSGADTQPNKPATEPEAIPADVIAAVQRLKGATTVTRTGQGYILNISVTSVDPARAAKLANAIADAYVVEKLDARFEAAKRASSWLSDRLVDLRKQLRQSEEAVATFRSENGFLSSSANVTLNQQQLSELNAKMLEARAEAADKKARVDLLQSIEEKGGNALSVPGVSQSTAFTALRQQEALISQKAANLEERYNDRHPLVVNVRAELADVKRAMAAEISRAANSIRNEFQLAKARESTVERTFREVTGQTGVDDRTAITLRELERTAAVNKSLFEDFLQKAKITQQQSSFEAREARVITPALTPTAPSQPRTFRTFGIAIFIGLFLGVGGSIAKDRLNGGFATPRQIEDMLDLPLLTSANVMDKRMLKVKDKIVQIPHYVAAMPLSRFSEAIRSLRSGIRMTDVDDPPKVVLVTSTSPGEGKTTMALSLAVSAASAGQKVLLIDADLRHTSSSKFFEMVKTPGLVDLLLGNVAPRETIKFNEQTKLWVLAAGVKTRNPADLLGSDRMKTFIAECKDTFDFVVIDAPPIGPVIDSLILSQLVDKIVYVVRWASTARELVQQSVRRLPREKLAGIAFNQVNEKAAQKYGKYGYQYYYGARDYKKYYSG